VSAVLESLRRYLAEGGATFREVAHPPTRTSEESAAARGEPLSVGGKALLLKVDDGFALFVLPADCKLDSAAVRAALAARKTRFASSEELATQTGGLVPGSVPPFGAPILPFPLYVDEKVFESDRVAFNAGSLTDSIVLAIADYRRLANPARVFSFGLRPNEE
jgi:Ala-tRNA(Pro) deacylase